MEITLYTTRQLLGLYREQEAPTSYFRDLGFNRVMNFDEEYIDFQKITESRRLAPLVMPTVQGRPIYTEASRLSRFKPAYLKPKDPISPSRVLRRRPTENLFSPNTLTPQQRYLSIVADILRCHRDAIERREEWMAAQVLQFGRVTLSGIDYETTTIDFERDPDHTVVLTGTDTWDNPAVNIMDELNAYIAKIRQAKFGGAVNRITVGAEVLPFILKNESVKKQLDLFTRGTNAQLNTGLRSGEKVEYIGNLGPNVQLWVNSEDYEGMNGEPEFYFDQKGVLLTTGSIEGVRCFGAILDDKAAFQALAVFPKMWTQEDPSGTFVMSQSAPLPAVVHPNNTLFIRALAE